jgi:hypothetical protein
LGKVGDLRTSATVISDQLLSTALLVGVVRLEVIASVGSWPDDFAAEVGTDGIDTGGCLQRDA